MDTPHIRHNTRVRFIASLRGLGISLTALRFRVRPPTPVPHCDFPCLSLHALVPSTAPSLVGAAKGEGRDSGARHASENRVYSVEFSFLTERDLSILEKVGREDSLPDRGGKLAVTP